MYKTYLFRHTHNKVLASKLDWQSLLPIEPSREQAYWSTPCVLCNCVPSHWLLISPPLAFSCNIFLTPILPALHHYEAYIIASQWILAKLRSRNRKQGVTCSNAAKNWSSGFENHIWSGFIGEPDEDQ